MGGGLRADSLESKKPRHGPELSGISGLEIEKVLKAHVVQRYVHSYSPLEAVPLYLWRRSDAQLLFDPYL